MARPDRFPEQGELVVGTVKSVKNFGAFISLDEYGEREGFIHIAEVATGWVKYIRNYVREGQKVVCKVMNVDVDKEHIDLSLKQVNEHQRREKIRLWKNELKAEKLLEFVGEKINKDVDDCYEAFANDLIEKYGSLYEAFEQSAIDQDSLKRDGFKGKWVKHFADTAMDNITPPFVKIRGYLELTTNDPEGIKHIQEALVAGEKEGEVTIKTRYVGAPKYEIYVNAPDYKMAEEELKVASEAILSVIKEKGGQGKFDRKRG